MAGGLPQPSPSLPASSRATRCHRPPETRAAVATGRPAPRFALAAAVPASPLLDSRASRPPRHVRLAGPARHDYHALVPCLGQQYGTSGGSARPVNVAVPKTGRAVLGRAAHLANYTPVPASDLTQLCIERRSIRRSTLIRFTPLAKA
jgi:hypothetical protein